jgi:hypothetical protein
MKEGGGGGGGGKDPQYKLIAVAMKISWKEDQLVKT